MAPRLLAGLAHRDISSRIDYRLHMLLWGFLVVSCALIAILVTVFLLGRANPLQATRTWTATAFAIFLVALVWQGVTTARLARCSNSRSAVIRAAFVPLAVLCIATGITDAYLYSSDEFNHHLAADTPFRLTFAVATLLALYATSLSQVALLGWVSGSSFRKSLLRQLSLQGEAGTLLSVAAIGVLQGTSYVTVMGDDYSRYWAIADALASGHGYPASAVASAYRAGGMSEYLVDLPGLPLAMLLSFALFGHNALSAMAPAVVGGSLFPVFAYLAFRELTLDVSLSHAVAVGLSLFPLLSFYVLRSAEPDGIFVSLLMMLAFLAIRCDRYPRQTLAWLALGLTAGLTALTRPEGLAYFGGVFLFLALSQRNRWAFWTALGVAATVLITFAAVMAVTFGTLWPTSFAGVVRWENIAQNLSGLARYALPRYSAALAIPEPLLVLEQVALGGLFGLGALKIGRRSPQLLFLAFVPVLNVVMFLLVSPALTRPDQPYDFFRRASYGLPYATMVASYPMAVALQRLRLRGSSLLATGLLIASSIAVVGYEVKLWAEPEEIYPLRTQILTSGTYVLATDLALHNYQIPHLPFERDGGNTVVSRSFDYMGFRDDLNSFYAPLDLHGSDRARSYALASLLVYLVGMFYAALTRHRSLFEPMTTVRF